MFYFQVQCYNCHHYGHFVKECTNVCNNNLEEKIKMKNEDFSYKDDKFARIDECEIEKGKKNVRNMYIKLISSMKE